MNYLITLSNNLIIPSHRDILPHFRKVQNCGFIMVHVLFNYIIRNHIKHFFGGEIYMSDYVLFSPLGLSDPTRGNFDGAFLHILRHLKPKKAYLFMTSEICHYDELDNRYEIMGHRVCTHEGFDCGFIKIKDPDLTDPHLFGNFYFLFENIIRKIKDENPGLKILINLSSSTPQMKEALHLICATSPYKLYPVQVVSPAGKANKSDPVGKDYDIEQEWANLIDNEKDLNPENRTNLIKMDNVNLLFSREIIKGSLLAYDYNSALTVANNIKELIGDDANNLIEAAFHRMSLNLPQAEKLADKAGYDMFPIKNEPAKTIFEYILSLRLKVLRREYADFIRAISPVLTDLFEQYVNNKTDISLKNDLCYKNSKGVFIMSKEKLLSKGLYKNFIKEFEAGIFEDRPLSAVNIIPLIIIKSDDDMVKNYALNLRKVEASVRNIVAHQIVNLDDKGIKEITSFSSQQILNFLTFIFSRTYNNFYKNNMLESYDELNKEIINRMQ